MKLRWGILGIGAACAACCIPLVMPLLAGAGVLGLGGGGAGMLWFGLSLEQVLCVGIPAVGGAALLGLWLRSRMRARAKNCACETACAVETCGERGRP